MKQTNINIDMDTLYEDLNIRVSNTERDKLIKISYEKVLPTMLDFFNKHEIKATFVVVGRDAKLVPKLVKMIADNGHEIANHTLNHKRCFSSLNSKEIFNEITKCNEIIQKITGEKCKGFRSPCYTTNSKILRILSENNFSYDMSINNSLLYQLIKRFYKVVLRNKDYIPHNQELSVIRAPNRPYKLSLSSIWKEGDSDIMEFPISNTRIFSIPFITQLHLSFGRILSNNVIKKYSSVSPLGINAHFMEFMDIKDFKSIELKNFVMAPKLAKMDYRIEYFENIIKVLKKQDFKFYRMDKIIEKELTTKHVS